MPNWCYNSVTVSAQTEAELKAFIEFANQPHTSRHINIYSKEREVVVDENAKGVFWNFITPPEEIRDEYFGEQPRYSDKLPVSDPDWYSQVEERRKVSRFWYDWNITNWGTKWDIIFDEHSEADIIELQDEWCLNWYFETAWSPAEPVFRAMAERFPNLEFNFQVTEEANFYAGYQIYKGGVLVKDDFAESPSHADYIRLDIPCVACNSEDSEEECRLGSGDN
jgi:hypothetical protein